MLGLSDRELLERFRAGDERALVHICARYEGPLFEFLVGLLRSHHQAEDALQETFVKALERLEGVGPDHLRGWLFTVAYHQAMLIRRRQKNRPAALEALLDTVVDPGPDPQRQAEQSDDARRLHELLDLLPTGQQDVIRQRVFEGKQFRDIATSLGCPTNTALSRMHEGLKRLRTLWKQQQT